jgi:hypothetical protein
MNPTIADCVNYIRSKGILKDWTTMQIANQIMTCLKENSFAFQTDINNKLISICLGRWHNSCCLHIIAIAGEPGSLKLLIRHLKHVYPTVKTLKAERYGKQIEYNVERL